MKTQSLLLAILMAVVFSACAQKSTEMHDGYYAAEADSFDSRGWKEYVSIYVNDNRIMTVEYDAENISGFIKSWDMDYMRKMNAATGTYPNKYMRDYAVALLNKQSPEGIDAVSGATESFPHFQQLCEAAIVQAKAGDKKVALIELPETND